MNMVFSKQVREQLALQLEKYMKSLPVKRSQMLCCWQNIQDNGWDHGCLNDLKTEVHRLSGSAGSYGLTELGTAAQNLDRLLSSENDLPDLPAMAAELMKELFRVIDKGIKTYAVTTMTR